VKGGVVADDDEDLWPPFYLSGGSGHSTREQRIQDRMQGIKDHGRRPPGRVRSLSRDQIVRTAIAVADTEGPDAISMRRIARELNAGAMSLYWHVSSKQELLDLMLDAIQGEMAVPVQSGDLRADLRAMAYGWRQSLCRHRWVMPFMGGRPPTGPKALRNIERALALFTPRQLGSATMMTVLMSVQTYVMGAVLREQQEERNQQDQDLAQERYGLTAEEMHKIVGEYLGRVKESGLYPNLTAMMDAGVDPDALETQDERFEFGLDCLLDGIVARLGSCDPATAPE
jgi:AcrR family transcriptional regulator